MRIPKRSQTIVPIFPCDDKLPRVMRSRQLKKYERNINKKQKKKNQREEKQNRAAEVSLNANQKAKKRKWRIPLLFFLSNLWKKNFH